MTGTSLHIKKIQRIVFMLAVFVALTPCSIKETLFSSFEITFERPLNKTKSTQSINTFCESEVVVQTNIECNSKLAAINLPDIANSITIIPIGCKKVALKQYAKRTSGKSPPMYILYKRLKFDIA
ncbi:hypothetical protein DHD08_04830 [Arenibacter sp. H213]|nr:hypothetical protein [Arenibacter sp. H213]